MDHAFMWIFQGTKVHPLLQVTASVQTYFCHFQINVYIVELTVGYETNLEKNAKRKKAKYSELVIDQSDHFEKVNFVNISMSSLGVYGKECSAFISMLNDLGFNENDRKYCIKRMTTTAIRTTYYVFYCRNKEWTSPELLTF